MGVAVAGSTVLWGENAQCRVRFGQSLRAADATIELRTTAREAAACFARAVAGLVEQAGIRAYVQVHLDLEASREWAHLAGSGMWAVDSVFRITH